MSHDTLLTSWNETATKAAITRFVASVTARGSPDFIAEPERIAVFDNDGTLWIEKPLPIQLDFLVRRFAEQAAANPSLQEIQPYKAAYEHDVAWLGQAMVKHYHGDDADMALLQRAMNEAFAKVSVDQYRVSADTFFATTMHPTLNRPYLNCHYQPMLELLRYLEANGFTCYIASGGDRDFVRAIGENLYAIPPERVIGSTQALDYQEHDDGTDVLYKAEVEVFDDGPAKPVRIWSRIGRRPVVAVGNSNGDIQMLRFARTASRPALRILVNHDDAEREFDYQAGAEAALSRAAEHDWTVVSMKHDWRVVFTE
jgi:phosphoserine phosphatase